MKTKTNAGKIRNFILLASTSLLLAACSSKAATSSQTTTTSSTSTVQTVATSTTVDETNATTIDLSKESGSTVEITKAGTYILTGEYKGQIHINAKDEEVVIILKNAKITSDSGPAIYSEAAKNTVVSLQGENSLTDSSNYPTGDSAPNATLYAKNDLVLTGDGSLSVKSNYKAAVRSKDILTIESGTYSIESTTDALKATDQILVLGGKIDIKSGSDGLQATSTKDGKGIITVKGGELNISAEKKGLKAGKVLNIEGGTINVTKSYEGFEAEVINIKGGKNSIVASDDGINASSSTTSSSKNKNTNSSSSSKSSDTQMNQGGPSGDMGQGGPGQGGGQMGGMPGGQEEADENLIVNITGGETVIKASGDGIDSNGNVNMSDGVVYVEQHGDGDAPLDFDGKFVQTGGTLVAMGSASMAQTTQGDQAGFALYKEASGQITIEDGKETLTYTPSNSYAFLFVSTPNMSKGGTIKVNGESYDLTDTITTSGEASNQMQGGRPF
ncbi:carbohydrate-binding domain-containing protein [Streptococcaceae bacterium ESL0687]|nr:carbohydrate-binding domain-containing protein [Streptococcaceae bacterium ESL0687]